MEPLEDFEKRIAHLMRKQEQPAISAFPKKFHQIVDHGETICLQLNDIECKLSKVTGDGQFIKHDDNAKEVITRKGTHFARIALRIPKDMLQQIKEALDDI